MNNILDSAVEILKEKTVGFQPHTYYLNKEGKCIAYSKNSTDDIKIFVKPLSFNKSYRKFDKVLKDAT